MASYDDFPELYSPDSSPWDSPCWNDDWEHELINNDYKTVQEWNKENRVIKEGEKGTHLPCAKKTIFSKGQTVLVNKNYFSNEIESIYFKTHEEAISWAKSNPGKVITRSQNRDGFIVKK